MAARSVFNEGARAQFSARHRFLDVNAEVTYQ
jgi:hypothetical protein